MLQFQCPHCGGAFQILPTMAGQQLACPHCTGVLLAPETLPSEPPAVDAPIWEPRGPEPPPAAPSYSAVPSSVPPIQFDWSATVPQTVPPVQTGSPVVERAPVPEAARGGQKREVRKLTSQERSTRRFVKNLIICAICAIVLTVLFWWLLHSGPL